MALWYYLLMCFIYGTTFLGIRVGDEAGMPPLLFGALRFCLAGVCTLIVMWVRDKSTFPTTWRMFLRLASVGLMTTTGVFAIVYEVERYVSSGYAALMAATMPFLVMLFGRLFYKQTIRPMQYFGLLVGFGGVFAIAWPGLHQHVPHWFLYTFLLVVAQVFASGGALQSRSVMADGVSPFVVNGFQLLFGGLGLFVLSACFESFSFRDMHSAVAGVGALLYLTIFGSLIASTLFYLLVQRIGTLLASTWTYVSPIIAVVVGKIVLDEHVYVWTIVGTAGIILGLVLLNFTLLSAALAPKQNVSA